MAVPTPLIEIWYKVSTIFNKKQTKIPTGYQINDQAGLYFLTFQIVDWIDVFSSPNYRQIILDSFTFCRKNKGLLLRAYVVMTNHIHLIAEAENTNLSDIVRDFKSHTSRQIWKAILSEPESRKEWMVERFEKAAKRHKRNTGYQIWKHDYHAIELISQKFIAQKMNYIHLNPVRAGWVSHENDWMYSSQRNYSGLYSVIEIDIFT